MKRKKTYNNNVLFEQNERLYDDHTVYIIAVKSLSDNYLNYHIKEITEDGKVMPGKVGKYYVNAFRESQLSYETTKEDIEYLKAEKNRFLDIYQGFYN